MLLFGSQHYFKNKIKKYPTLCKKAETGGSLQVLELPGLCQDAVSTPSSHQELPLTPSKYTDYMLTVIHCQDKLIHSIRRDLLFSQINTSSICI